MAIQIQRVLLNENNSALSSDIARLQNFCEAEFGFLYKRCFKNSQLNNSLRIY